MTIGDVLAAVALISTALVSWVALLLLAAYVMPKAVGAAGEALEQGVGRCAGVGVGVLLIGVLAIGRVMAFGGVGRIVGMGGAGVMICAAAVGGAAIVRVMARGVAARSPWAEPGVGDLAKAAGVFAVAGLFPVAGWFVVAPVAMVVSLGAVARGMRLGRRVESAAGVGGADVAVYAAEVPAVRP